MPAPIADLSSARAPLARSRERTFDAELAYIFEVPDADIEIDEELSAALEPLDD